MGSLSSISADLLFSRTAEFWLQGALGSYGTGIALKLESAPMRLCGADDSSYEFPFLLCKEVDSPLNALLFLYAISPTSGRTDAL